MYVMMSSGLDPTRKMQSDTAASTAGIIPEKISALRDSRSSRLSPGFWLARSQHDKARASEIGYLPGADPDRI